MLTCCYDSVNLIVRKTKFDRTSYYDPLLQSLPGLRDRKQDAFRLDNNITYPECIILVLKRRVHGTFKLIYLCNHQVSRLRLDTILTAQYKIYPTVEIFRYWPLSLAIVMTYTECTSFAMVDATIIFLLPMTHWVFDALGQKVAWDTGHKS